MSFALCLTSSKLCTNSFTLRICKTSKENKILIKMLRQEKRYGTKRLLAEFPQQTLATHNCEASAAEDRLHQNVQWKKTKSYLNKIEYNFSNTLLILCVKYLYNRLRSKAVIDKVIFQTQWTGALRDYRSLPVKLTKFVQIPQVRAGGSALRDPLLWVCTPGPTSKLCPWAQFCMKHDVVHLLCFDWFWTYFT